MKKRLVIMIIVLVILLIGGGIEAYIYFQNHEGLGNVNLNHEYTISEYVNGEYQNNNYINSGDSNAKHSSDGESLSSSFNPDLPISNENWPDNLPKHIPDSVALQSAELLEEKWFLRFAVQHRAIYYQIPPDISDLVYDQVAVRLWMEEEFWVETFVNYPMALMRFVQHFNILKEDFVAVIEETRIATEELAQEFGWDLSHEDHELPNADIIFTFDPEIISYFYRRE